MAKRNDAVKCDLFLSVCEPSGDLHGAEILKKLYPFALNIHGISGPKMRKLGIVSHFHSEDFNVMGFFDVLVALPKIISLFRKVKKKILQLNPKVVVLIDYPGFHLRMAKALKKANFKGKIVQYVCPSVWAWKKNRIQIMEKNLDLLLSLLPFESKYFEDGPLKTKFIGHPLAKSISKHELFRKKNPQLVAIFPGSRKKEVLRNLPIQLRSCFALKNLYPSFEFNISVADPSLIEIIQKLNFAKFPLTMPEENSRLMQSASFAIATSGTVTLELALHGVFSIITYALPKIDQWIATKIFGINLPFYCIVNIILEKQAFPEFIGTNLSPLTLLKALENLILREDLEELKQLFFELKSNLSDQDAASESAKEIIKMI